MYNKEQKERFMETSNRAVESTMNRIFDLAEMLETLYDKDMYDFTEEQGIELLKTFRSESIESLGVIASNIISYVDWALMNNLVADGVNHFREITKEQRDSCVSIKAKDRYYSKQELMEMFNDLKDNPVNQFLLLAPWYSVGAKYKDEVDNVCAENVAGHNLYLNSRKGGERKIEIDDVFCKTIVDSQMETMYYSPLTGTERQLKGHGAFKICYNSKNDPKIELKINRGFVRISKILGKDVNYNTIRFSAMIYRIQEGAKELGITTQDFVFSDHVFPILDLFQFRTTLVNAQRQSSFWYKFQSYLANK